MSRLRKRVYKKYDVEDKTKLEGLTFGFLTVIKRIEDSEEVSGYTNIKWLCKCTCGKEKIYRGYDLINGVIKSCGCARSRRLDLSGRTFGTLTVDHYIPHTGWLCKCICGNEVVKSSHYLIQYPDLNCGDTEKHPRQKHLRLRLDFTGKTFKGWKVLGRDTDYQGQKVKYIIESKDGERKSVFSTYIQQYLKHQKEKKKINRTSLKGKVFGKLKVLSLVKFEDENKRIKIEKIYDGKFKEVQHVKKAKSKQWLCQCECGNQVVVKTSSLLNGSVEDCGCSSYEDRKGVYGIKPKKKFIGRRFGKLVVLENTGKFTEYGSRLWLCRCECGREKEISERSLKSGTHSCGCLKGKKAKEKIRLKNKD